MILYFYLLDNAYQMNKLTLKVDLYNLHAYIQNDNQTVQGFYTYLTRTIDNIYRQPLPSVGFPFDIPEKSIVFNFDKFYFLMKWLTPGWWVGSKSAQRRRDWNQSMNQIL